MLILTIRTDKPEAEIGLYEGQTQLAYETWHAHRKLAETLLSKIEVILEQQGKSWDDVQGIICYQGPGSFTGLRIGLTVANTLSKSLGMPIVASQDPQWIEAGTLRLLADDHDEVALPFYGADAHITLPKK